MAKIIIAGASGFVGQQLARELMRQGHSVIGLTRNPNPRSTEFEWRTADLFSIQDATHALRGGEIAFYLVHSMLASAQLTQASFEDLDLLVAENFAQAAKVAGIRQILYLGGILPQSTTPLSRHLASRLEVESALGSTGIPVTNLRAGLIVGPEGSSFQLLLRLVQRLPAMLTPAWTSTPAQPIDERDVVRLLAFCIDRKECLGQTFDIAGDDILTYRTMLELTARHLKVRRGFFSVPLFTPRLSTLWVCLITGAPRALVAPLVDSLKHTMLARDNRLIQLSGIRPHPFEAALREALQAPKPNRPRAFERTRLSSDAVHAVRSIQRFSVALGTTAEDAARMYVEFLSGFIQVRHEGSTLLFRLLGIPMLVLTRSAESNSTRVLYRITGGLLVRNHPKGRLEFQIACGGKALLTAVHDFHPRLPWPIYKYTQALLHLAVMRLFGSRLRGLSQKRI
jgi:uncharacterized protein YbjT (DUF2867 family)